MAFEKSKRGSVENTPAEPCKSQKHSKHMNNEDLGFEAKLRKMPFPKNRKARVLDLFSGCGGLSLGFLAAGYEIVDGIENDPDAHKTHAQNFHLKTRKSPPNDIQDVSASTHLSSKDIRGGSGIDVVIGGPPCQPFARVGRAKLREIAGLVEAHIYDERVTLYEHFLRFVAELHPLAFVIENVTEIGRFAGRNIAEEISISAENLGYNVRYTLLNAAWYGVPQLRERIFIIGIKGDVGQIPIFPDRTHKVELPKGYKTSQVANGNIPFLAPYDHFTDHVGEIINPQLAVTSREAIGDLAPILDHLVHMEAKKGARHFSDHIRYVSEPCNSYQGLMRRWLGNGEIPPPKDHVIRFTPRDYETFRRMEPGNQYPEAHEIAVLRLKQTLEDVEKERGFKLEKNTEEYQKLWDSIVPPYSLNKFPNRWRKMEPDAPVRTITAHIGKDSYSHIHYDSDQARTISVREAARLQSFPDSFHFCGSMNKAFKQIGNSVPPLLAYAIAMALKKQLIAADVIRFSSEDDKTYHQNVIFNKGM